MNGLGMAVHCQNEADPDYSDMNKRSGSGWGVWKGGLYLPVGVCGERKNPSGPKMCVHLLLAWL